MATPTRDSVATNLRRIRKEQKLTQEELAFRSGLTVSYISHLERKKQSVSLKSLDKISSALGVSPVTLVVEVKHKKLPAVIMDEIQKLLERLEDSDSAFVLNYLRALAQHLMSVRSEQTGTKKRKK